MALSKQPVFRSGRQLSRHNGTSRRNLTPLEPSPALHENKLIFCARLGQHIPYQTLPVTYTGAGLPVSSVHSEIPSYRYTVNALRFSFLHCIIILCYLGNFRVSESTIRTYYCPHETSAPLYPTL